MHSSVYKVTVEVYVDSPNKEYAEDKVRYFLDQLDGNDIIRHPFVGEPRTVNAERIGATPEWRIS